VEGVVIGNLVRYYYAMATYIIHRNIKILKVCVYIYCFIIFLILNKNKKNIDISDPMRDKTMTIINAIHK